MAYELLMKDLLQRIEAPELENLTGERVRF